MDSLKDLLASRVPACLIAAPFAFCTSFSTQGQCVGQISDDVFRPCTIVYTVDSAGAFGAPSCPCDSLVVITDDKRRFAIIPRMQRTEALELSKARLSAVVVYKSNKLTRWRLDAAGASSLRDVSLCVSQGADGALGLSYLEVDSIAIAKARSPGLMITKGAQLKNAGALIGLLSVGIGTLFMFTDIPSDARTGVGLSLAGLGLGVGLTIGGNSMQAKAGILLYERGY